MSKYTIFILLLILILIFEAVTGYLKIRNSKQGSNNLITPTMLSPSPSPIIESVLSFSPDTISANTGASSEADVEINTQGEFPNLIQLELAYDPLIISDVKLVPGDFLENPNVLLNNIDEKTGRISYAMSLPEGKKGKQLSGTAAKLIFNVNKKPLSGETSIYFLPKTAISADDKNIPLKIAYGLKININSSSINVIPVTPKLKPIISQ